MAGFVVDLSSVLAWGSMAYFMGPYLALAGYSGASEKNWPDKANSYSNWGDRVGDNPPGGYYQSFKYTTENDGGKDGDAVPNAYIAEDADLIINSVSQTVSIGDYFNDDETLTYFYDWLEKGSSSTITTENPVKTNPSDPRIIQITPLYGDENSLNQGKVIDSGNPNWNNGKPGYDYTGHKFKHINYALPIQLWTTGLANIDTSDLTKYVSAETALDGKARDKLADDEYIATGYLNGDGLTDPMSSAWDAPSTDDGAGASFQIKEIKGDLPYVFTLEADFTKSITSSETESVTNSQTDSVTNKVGVDVELKYDQSWGVKDVDNTDVSAKLESDYEKTWENTETVTASNSTESGQSAELDILFSLSLDITAEYHEESDKLSFSTPTYDASGVQDGEDENFVNPGDDVYFDLYFSKGSYNTNLKYPYNLAGSFGGFKMGTVIYGGEKNPTPNGDPTSAWKSSAGETYYLDGLIGTPLAYALDESTPWYTAMRQESAKEALSVQNNDAVVRANTTVTTDLGKQVIVSVTTSPPVNSLTCTAVECSPVSFAGSPSRQEKYQKWFKGFLGQKNIDPRLALKFKDSGFYDYKESHRLEGEHPELSKRESKSIPGYTVTSDSLVKSPGSSIIVLPRKTSIVDFAGSDENSFVIASSPKNKVHLGDRNDVFVTARRSASSVSLGKGNDTVYSHGKADYIESGKGKKRLIIKGVASLDLAGGQDSIFAGRNARLNIRGFTPGLTSLSSLNQASTHSGQGQNNQVRLRLAETSVPHFYRLFANSPEFSHGNVSLDFDHDVRSDLYWTDYALRIKNGFLLKRLDLNDPLSDHASHLDMGSQIKYSLQNSLGRLSDLGKRYFMKKGFAEGVDTYTRKFDDSSRDELVGNVSGLLARTHKKVFRRLGGQSSFDQVLLENPGIDFSSHAKSAPYVDALVVSALRGVTSSSDVDLHAVLMDLGVDVSEALNVAI